MLFVRATVVIQIMIIIIKITTTIYYALVTVCAVVWPRAVSSRMISRKNVSCASCARPCCRAACQFVPINPCLSAGRAGGKCRRRHRQKKKKTTIFFRLSPPIVSGTESCRGNAVRRRRLARNPGSRRLHVITGARHGPHPFKGTPPPAGPTVSLSRPP